MIAAGKGGCQRRPVEQGFQPAHKKTLVFCHTRLQRRMGRGKVRKRRPGRHPPPQRPFGSQGDDDEAVPQKSDGGVEESEGHQAGRSTGAVGFDSAAGSTQLGQGRKLERGEPEDLTRTGRPRAENPAAKPARKPTAPGLGTLVPSGQPVVGLICLRMPRIAERTAPPNAANGLHLEMKAQRVAFFRQNF